MNQTINVCLMGIDDASTFHFSGTAGQALDLLKNTCRETGIHVVRTASLEEGADNVDALKQSDAVVIFLPLSDFQAPHRRTAAERILKIARERDVKIFYISDHQYTDWLSKGDILEASTVFRGCIFLAIQDGNLLHSAKTIIAELYNRLNAGNEKGILYDKLSEMKRLNYDVGIADVACQLISVLCKEIPTITSTVERRKTIKEILSLWVSAYHCCYLDAHLPEGRSAAHTKIGTVTPIDKLLHEEEFLGDDPYYAALAVNFIYVNALVLHDSIASITNDDVFILREENRKKSFIEQQRPFFQKLDAALTSEAHRAAIEKLPKDERKLIDEVEEARIESLYADSHGGLSRNKNGVMHCVTVPKPEDISAPTEEEKILLSIADIMHKATQLFYDITDQGMAVEYMRCLKTSYERLRNYCEIVGDRRIAAECVSKIAEIVNVIEKHDFTESISPKIENGIKAYLGLKLPTNNHFDVFLSYKHEDKDIAGKCYHYLKENHLHTFLDFITLPELSDSDYEEVIMRALDNSRHFVVIITKLEQLESHWIKLEMKTFEHEMSEGRKEGSNFILLVSEDVFDQIIKTNKRCLPIRYRSMEVMKISSYRDTLASYLTPGE